MQRLCRRSTLCRPARRSATPTALQPCLSVRAQWMAIPVTSTLSTLHRCLATTSDASSASPPPRRSTSTSTSNAFMVVGLAVLAGTAALYVTAPAAAEKRHHDQADKRHAVQPTKRMQSVDSTPPPAQHLDSTEPTSPPTAPSTLSSPAAAADDSDVTAAQPTNDTTTASTSTNKAVDDTSSIHTPPPAPPVESSTAAPPSHNHSPPAAAAAASTPRPLTAAEVLYLARYYSAPADEHPAVRNLHVLTANRIDEVVATSPPFLLYLFDPTCAACSLYTPIVHALAYALDTSDEKEEEEEEEEEEKGDGQVEGVRVYVMNDATDYKPGFLSPDEENVLPILKFFPQSSTAALSTTSPSASLSSPSSPPSATPFQYTGSPHLSSILRFLHQHTNGAFNLDRALQRARSRLPALREELTEKGAKRLESSEDWALYLHSPCGPLIQQYSMAELMNKYVEGGEPAEGKYERFVACMEEKEDDTLEYFETMAMIANETVQQLREKREKKRRTQRSDGGDNDSPVKDDDDRLE